MERGSPRARKSTRAGKSIAADDTAHTKIRPQRKAGRDRTDGGLGYPDACTGESDNPLAPCRAILRGKQCLACIRVADWPLGIDWNRGAAQMPGASVQVVRSADDGCWFVVAFLGGFTVDPRFPVIACNDRTEAIELAHIRARHIEPAAPIEDRGGGDWRYGRLTVWVLSYGS